MHRRMNRFVIASTLALALSACAAQQAAEDRVAAAPPIGLESALRLGDAALAGGDYSSAVRILQMAVDAHPAEPRAHRSLANAYFEAGAFPEAEVAYDQLSTLEPGEAEPLVGLGRVALSRGDPATAEREFRAALAADPTSIPAMNGLGVALDLAGRHAEAQATYAKILERSPANRAVMNNLALSRALAGDRDQARRDLEILSHGAAGMRQARHNLALVRALDGDIGGARAILREELPAEEAEANINFYAAL